MKKILQNPLIRKVLIYLLGLLVILVLLDRIILPWYVSSPEIVVPKILGLVKEEAIKELEKSKLYPIVADTSYDERYPKGTILLQRPEAGKMVKEGRRIYIFVSGGESLVKIPNLKGKSIRDAKFALERIGLKLGAVEEVPSNHPRAVIFDQQYTEGTRLKKGARVAVSISSGGEVGEIVIPDLIGKSLSEAESILRTNSLKIGKINYQRSYSLLPNTILDQYPSGGNKVKPGDVVDLFVTKAADSKDEKEILEE